MTILKDQPRTKPSMVEKISLTAGEIWLELDKSGGMHLDDLFARLEHRGASKDLLWMALGWLVYQKHTKWTSGKNGGQVVIVSPEVKGAG